MKIHLNALPPTLNKEDSNDVICAIDIEVGNLPEGMTHIAGLGDFAVMTMTCDGENVYAITETDMIQDALDAVRFTMWAMHYGSFDITHLRHFALIPARIGRGEYWDTMHVDRVAYQGMFDSFSLQSLARRWLEVRMEKEIRSEFIEWDGVLTEEQLEYACLDTVITWKIAQKQLRFIPSDAQDYWWNVDNKTLWAYMDFADIPVDRDGWLQLAEENEKRVEELQAKYPDVLLTSSPQVIKHLKSLGYSVTSSAEKVLQKLLSQNPDDEFINDLLEFRTVQTLASRYGKSWMDNAFQKDDGYWYIRPAWDINRALSGRPQANNPAIQTVPVRKHPIFRTFIRAIPGWVLVVGDYSQQEPRIATWFSKDKKLIKVFEDGGDVYVAMGKIMFGNDYEITHDIRNKIKDTVLGINYGQSIKSLAEQWGVPYGEAKRFYYDFANAFPELFDWLDGQNMATDYVTTVLGRKIWFNPHYYQAYNHKRNLPIQGSAADMKKVSVSTRMWEKWNQPFSFGIGTDMHDEFLAHVPEQYGKQMKTIMEKAMVETAEEMCAGVPFKVEAKIVSNWLEAK